MKIKDSLLDKFLTMSVRRTHLPRIFLKTEHQALLTDQERCALLEPETLNIGQYTAYRPTRLCDFIVSINGSPLVALIDTANYGSRIYELMSIRRPGDILHYLSLHIIDVGDEVEKFVKEKVLPFFADFDAPFKDVPFCEFDGCFKIRGEDTECFERSWCYHRESSYWKDKLDPILLLVEDVQRRIRKKSDYLLQHEINLIDHKRNRIDYLPRIDRLVSWEVMVGPETTL